MTHPALRGGLAAELDRLAQRLVQGWTWPSPAAGFAAWVFARRGTTPFFGGTAPAGASGVPEGRLTEAPVLACLGYELALSPAVEPPAGQAWAAAMRRLSGRDPRPADRQSFLFRPLELLGLTVGADAIAALDPQPRQWLRGVVAEGFAGPSGDVWTAVLTGYASDVLGAAIHASDARSTGVASLRTVRTADLGAVDLAAMWLLAVDRPAAAQAAELPANPEELRVELLNRAATSTVAHPDLAEAALLHLALTDAVRRNIEGGAVARRDAVDLVVGLCRRFPAIVRELAVRHDNRPPFVINDEYDVQDLMRALLRGLFDDVRPEEPTPSRGGVPSRTDFLLKREQIVVETKMTRPRLGQRQVAEELAIDKEFYRAHPDARTLICFVYDPGHRLGNPAALETDLSDLDDPLPTVVVVAPTT